MRALAGTRHSQAHHEGEVLPETQPGAGLSCLCRLVEELLRQPQTPPRRQCIVNPMFPADSSSWAWLWNLDHPPMRFRAPPPAGLGSLPNASHSTAFFSQPNRQCEVKSPWPGVWLLCFIYLFICLLFRAAPMAYVAYRVSEVRGLMRAAAAGLHHSHSKGGI